MKVQMRPYMIEKKVEPMPALVKAFLEGNFKQQAGDYTVEIISDRQDTGQGMSYMNRLIVKQGDQIVYDTGMITYRDGRSGYPTDHDQCYRKAGVKVSESYLFLGIETATGKVRITEVRMGLQGGFTN